MIKKRGFAGRFLGITVAHHSDRRKSAETPHTGIQEGILDLLTRVQPPEFLLWRLRANYRG